ncbi:MAG: esterase family protein [Gammaproteobacteria bacterium]|jgi:enterochelin esterase-like enzyme|nr:esterase family protein [Gammaproteobacteria bacterium]MBT5204765.1 esterase family protein [Gammaproteobacteria bacterium]MBT5601319.1 esterase family protein [Gammaproteobacteria bacterium]MBT6244994.1 esterase family protein [Gammaproteobacteria bacterium]
MPMMIEDYLALNLDQAAPGSVNGCSNDDVRHAVNLPEDDYQPCIEAQALPADLQGQVIKLPDWSASRIYPHTSRDIWLYRPVKVSSDECLKAIIFNDGGAYLARQGAVRATLVLDWLHSAGLLQNTIAVFVNPGNPAEPHIPPAPIESYGPREAQRSWEYDRLTADYGRFLVEDILPLAETSLDCRISPEAADRIICGISSGGIAAFNAAWHFPKAFGNVISHCGSFTNIWGGHHFPYLVRSSPRKPIRVFLQSGENDAQTLFGDWGLANKAMASALQYAGYEMRFEFGTGGHTLKHAGACFSEALRWIWSIDG